MLHDCPSCLLCADAVQADEYTAAVARMKNILSERHHAYAMADLQIPLETSPSDPGDVGAAPAVVAYRWHFPHCGHACLQCLLYDQGAEATCMHPSYVLVLKGHMEEQQGLWFSGAGLVSTLSAGVRVLTSGVDDTGC